MNYSIRFPALPLQGAITLPFSKSISNRLLVIKALTRTELPIHNLSESDDTRHMASAFESRVPEVNIGHAGTAMRFLTAFFTVTAQKRIITGSERMKNRPIGALVDALNSLGADIQYVEKEGYPPLKTSGRVLTGAEIELKGSISSQYITALLLVAPALPNGLTIRISDYLISSSYVRMTLEMMKTFGIESQWENNTIIIPHQEYQGREYTVEADWSGASYWYQIALLTEISEIKLMGLFEKSSQGDQTIVNLFKRLGVDSEFFPGGVILRKTHSACSFFEFDFIENPDMVQTFVVALCLKGIPFSIRGAQSLRIKETDRIAALQQEMSKLGFVIEEPQPGVLSWHGTRKDPDDEIQIETYDDHRMGLAFAPAAICFPGLVIRQAEVVSKSYPLFWEDLKVIGVQLTAVQ